MGSNLDSSETKDLLHNGTVFILVVTVFNLGRMWMDAFILAVNCRDWMNKKGLTLTDRILTLQGSIRICLACITAVWYILEKFSPWIAEIGLVFKVLMFILWYFTVWNLWLTASLCSYYCVKIADFRHPFFIRLKLRLSGLVSTWLFSSLVLSFASSFPCIWCEIRHSGNISCGFRNKNASDINETSTASHVLVLLGLGCFAALSVCATSALLLLFSLWRHHRRMLGSLTGHRSPQTKAHFQAVIIILALLINNIVAFLSILLILSSNFGKNTVVSILSVSFLYACLLLESLISIWGNTKLKNQLCRALAFAKCRGNAG